MAPSFEQPNKTSAENLESKTNSHEAMERAEKSVEEFLHQLESEVSERVTQDPTVHFKGRDWKLDELPAKYGEIAHMQKKTSLMQEELDQVMEKNEQTQPGTIDEAVSYFKAQLLARTKEAQEQKTALEAQLLGLELQHPDIYKALKARQ